MATGLAIEKKGEFDEVIDVMIAEAAIANEEATILKPLVMNKDLPSGVDRIRLPFMGKIQAYKLEEGSWMNQERYPIVTTREVSSSEYGLLSFVSDQLEKRSTASVMDVLSKQHGDAIARMQDQEGFKIFPAFTTIFGGDGAGTPKSQGINANVFRDGQYLMKQERDPHFGPINMGSSIRSVLHPGAMKYLMENTLGMTGGNAGPIFERGTDAVPVPSGPSASALKQAYQGRVTYSNVDVYEAPLMPVRTITVTTATGAVTEDPRTSTGSAASGTDIRYTCTGAMFVKDAICYVDDRTLRVEQERSARMRGNFFVSSIMFGWYPMVDPWGIQIDARTYHMPFTNFAVGPSTGDGWSGSANTMSVAGSSAGSSTGQYWDTHTAPTPNPS